MKDLPLWARIVVRTSNTKICRRRLADYVKPCTKKRAARAAWLLFLIQPIKSVMFHGGHVGVPKQRLFIKSLICGVFVVFLNSLMMVAWRRIAGWRNNWKSYLGRNSEKTYLSPFLKSSENLFGRSFIRCEAINIKTWLALLNVVEVSSAITLVLRPLHFIWINCNSEVYVVPGIVV